MPSKERITQRVVRFFFVTLFFCITVRVRDNTGTGGEHFRMRIAAGPAARLSSAPVCGRAGSGTMRSFKWRVLVCVLASMVFEGRARADAIADNLNVYRMSPPLAAYTPGSIVRGHLDKRTYQRTGEKLLKVNVVRCRAAFDKDGIEENLDSAAFAVRDQKSFGLSAGWANLLNASFKGSYVEDVTLTFTGTIYEYTEDKLAQLRVRCLGSKNPKGDQGRFQFQIVRQAVGRFEYQIKYSEAASAGLKVNIVNKLAAELGGGGQVDREGKITIPRGAMAYPLWREDW
jgi:hypothetical protein